MPDVGSMVQSESMGVRSGHLGTHFHFNRIFIFPLEFESAGKSGG